MGEPTPGDFFVTATAGRLIDRIAAWLIRFGTNSNVNHAGLYIGDGVIVEAVGKVRYNEITAYPDAIWSTGRLPAHLTPTAQQRQAIVNKAHDLIGTPYSWLDIIAIGLAQRRLGQVVNSRTWWARRVSADGRYICSQAVDVEYQAGGIEFFDDGRLPGLVSPEDLEELLLPESAAA